MRHEELFVSVVITKNEGCYIVATLLGHETIFS